MAKSVSANEWHAYAFAKSEKKNTLRRKCVHVTFSILSDYWVAAQPDVNLHEDCVLRSNSWEANG